MQLKATTYVEYVDTAPAVSFSTCGTSRANWSLPGMALLDHPVGPARALARRAMR